MTESDASHSWHKKSLSFVQNHAKLITLQKN
jgi:hypothetical protein